MEAHNLKRITQSFSHNFNETCKQHHHIGDLPCPWPDCSLGVEDNAFIMISNWDDKERKIVRKSWIANDGGQRYSWDDTTTFSYFAVKKMIREEMVRIFGENQFVNSKIYHYTSIDGFFNIIKSNELWLTDYCYMNDANEINHGVDLAREILIEIKNEIAYKDKKDNIDKWCSIIEGKLFDRICIACFSSEKDSLSQWRGYGSSKIGICLGLSWNDKFFISDTQARLNLVVYDHDKQLKIIRNLFHIFLVISEWDKHKTILDFKGNIIDTKSSSVDDWAIRDLFYEYLVYFKNYNFCDEKEIRWVYTESRELHDKFNLAYAEKKFRCTNNLIIPYTSSKSLFNINLPKSYGINKENSSLPLKEVVIGPQEHIDMVVKGVREFLDENGFESVSVTKSNIPFRPSR